MLPFLINLACLHLKLRTRCFSLQTDIVESCCSQVSPCITDTYHENDVWQHDKTPPKWHENKENCRFTRHIHTHTFMEHTVVGASFFLIYNTLFCTFLSLAGHTQQRKHTRQLCQFILAHILSGRQQRQRQTIIPPLPLAIPTTKAWFSEPILGNLKCNIRI